MEIDDLSPVFYDGLVGIVDGGSVIVSKFIGGIAGKQCCFAHALVTDNGELDGKRAPSRSLGHMERLLHGNEASNKMKCKPE